MRQNSLPFMAETLPLEAFGRRRSESPADVQISLLALNHVTGVAVALEQRPVRGHHPPCSAGQPIAEQRSCGPKAHAKQAKDA